MRKIRKDYSVKKPDPFFCLEHLYRHSTFKKAVILFSIGLLCSSNVHADDNYPDDEEIITTTTKPIELSSEIETTKSYYGLGFYSYDGGENYSLSFGFYNFNGVGFGMNLRGNFKFSDHQATSNSDVLLNYSIGVYSNNDVMFLITPEIGPSLGMRDVYKDGKFEECYYIDGFAGIKATIAYKAIVLSAGYHIWAPKWKFGKDEKVDGFYAQLGFDF